MSIADRLTALGRGVAQSATGGWADEGYAKILDWLPRQEEEIPREYAGGSAYNQYRDEARSDNAESQRKYPGNYMAGQILGGAPAAIATGGAGAAGSVGLGAGLGALSGAGTSENTGRELAKDAARGAAVGGGLAAGANALAAAAPMARAGFDRMMAAAPKAQLQPAVAGANKMMASKPQVNMSYDPRQEYYGKFTKGFDRLKNQGKISQEAFDRLEDTGKKLAAKPRGEPVAPLSSEEQDAILAEALKPGGMKTQKMANRRFVGEETGEEFSAPVGEKGAKRLWLEDKKKPLDAALKAQEAPKKTIRPGKGRPR